MQHLASVTIAGVTASDASANFGDMLRDHRRAAGLTQEELGERAGVSPRSISELERGGAHIPRRDTVALLARALGLTGAVREGFEAMVERRRGPRLNADETPETAAPRSARRAVERTDHDLRRSLTSFVGRERELSELASVLQTTPLLTLVGPGGVGKTRLALELVRAQSANYADAVCFVELAALADPALLPDTLATAVGMRDLYTQSAASALSEYLRNKRTLLVLDNCEHLVEACAQLVAQLLRTCPDLQVLATSREPLAIAGETTWRVPPLELPGRQASLSLEQLQSTAAARLFIDRARAVNHALDLTEHNARAIARICIGVDGIPLALELAAARTRVLTIGQLADRLEHDSGVLGGASRAGEARHQTIRATIDWSYALLDESEQALLRRLSVFAGGWLLPVAEGVCSGGGIEPTGVLDLLTQLVDKSLAVVDTRDDVARYRLLEPIRQYAHEKLEAADEATLYSARHAAALLELAQTGETALGGPDEIATLDRLEVEHDNVRAALRWSLATGSGQAESGLRSATALFGFWERRGHYKEGCTWLDQALAAAEDAGGRLRAPALNALATLRWRSGETERAYAAAEQAFTLSGEVGDSAGVAWSLVNLGMLAYLQNQPDQAIARLEESVPVARHAGAVPALSLALAYLGRTRLWVKGPLDQRAADVLEESLALAMVAQSRYAAGHALAALGDLVWQLGDAERAMTLWQRALRVRAELDDRRGIAGCLERVALGLAASHRFEAAAWLFGAAETQHQALGVRLHHDEEPDHQHLLEVTREQLGEAFSAPWAHGQSSTVDDAVKRALDNEAWPRSRDLSSRPRPVNAERRPQRLPVWHLNGPDAGRH
jgi:predicted ATPase/transcriptional regulator with XRE-family HTH domain